MTKSDLLKCLEVHNWRKKLLRKISGANKNLFRAQKLDLSPTCAQTHARTHTLILQLPSLPSPFLPSFFLLFPLSPHLPFSPSPFLSYTSFFYTLPPLSSFSTDQKPPVYFSGYRVEEKTHKLFTECLGCLIAALLGNHRT